MAGTIVVDRIESDGSFASKVNVASPVNFASTTQIGGVDDSIGNFRNRIINGDMTVCQRYTTSYSSTSSGVYYVDRWRTSVDVPAANVTFQQSTDAPAGFKNSLSCTILTANTPVSGTGYNIIQPIEGQNIVDFKQGTSDAVPMTLSFWVKSSITGTYSTALRNTSGAKTCVKTYTINQANTWEYKSVTFPPETSGTWNTNNTAGCFVNFVLGAGSSLNAPSEGVWHTGTYSTVSGTVNLIATQNAVFKFTGVQFEKGSLATPYEHKPYATELQMCKRYYTSYGCNLYASWGHGNWIYNPSTACGVNLAAQTGPMRTTATMTLDSSVTNLYGINTSGTSKALTDISVRTHDYAGTGQVQLQVSAASGWDYNYVTWSVSASGMLFKFDAEL